jgi:hypothetical protein
LKFHALLSAAVATIFGHLPKSQIGNWRQNGGERINRCGGRELIVAKFHYHPADGATAMFTRIETNAGAT